METMMIECFDKNLSEVLWPTTPFDLQKHALVVCRRGSEAQGTYVPSTDPNSIDDRDLMVIYAADIDFYLGLRSKIKENYEGINGCWDVCMYEYRKFVNLLIKQNPNVVGMLWLEEEDYLYKTPAFQTLIDNKLLFRSKQAYHSFVGYAKGQLSRIKGTAGQGYLGSKRKELVAKYGYDIKDAGHVIRLLHMAQEFMETGMLNVKRRWDRLQLIDIKTGKWPFDAVIEHIEKCFIDCDKAAAKTFLPERVDLDPVNEIYKQILFERMGIKIHVPSI